MDDNEQEEHKGEPEKSKKVPVALRNDKTGKQFTNSGSAEKKG